MKYLFSLLLTILIYSVQCRRGYNSGDRVLLSSINTLTFYASKYTTGYRSRSFFLFLFHFSPIRQMKCLGGSAGCRFAPSSMQCYNRGSDGIDVQVLGFLSLNI